MGDINKLIERMRYWCDKADLGYDQASRWDIRDGGECDCSSLVIFALRESGFDTGTATYTGNMRANLTARGWVCVTPDGCPHPGDILLNDNNHVAVCTGWGILSQASRGESGHRVSGGRAGDQDGYETNTRDYYDYPWSTYLRYEGEDLSICETQVQDVGAYSIEELAAMVIEGKFETGEIRRRLLGERYGEVQKRVNEILAGGLSVGSNDGPLDVDGDIGPVTVACWQEAMGVKETSVIAGQDSGNRKYVPNVSSMRFTSTCKGARLVRVVQELVGAEVDGLWGHETTCKIQEWLNSIGYGLDADGYCGPLTASAIQRSLNAGMWSA